MIVYLTATMMLTLTEIDCSPATKFSGPFLYKLIYFLLIEHSIPILIE